MGLSACARGVKRGGSLNLHIIPLTPMLKEDESDEMMSFIARKSVGREDPSEAVEVEPETVSVNGYGHHAQGALTFLAMTGLMTLAIDTSYRGQER